MLSPGAANTTNLPLSDPLWKNDACLAYKTAHDASQTQISWASQFEYGHLTTYYYLTFVALFGLIYWFRRLVSVSEDFVYPAKRTTFVQKAKVVWRSIIYRRLGIGMSLGISSLICLSVLFATILTFAQKPYYRLHCGFGSPPLAVRTGLMAVALIPIIVALSGKYNAVTLITGISHERLNVFHQYVAYICLALSVVHTISFIVAPLRHGGVRSSAGTVRQARQA
jgi:Ferric reductase like transmembrane component